MQKILVAVDIAVVSRKGTDLRLLLIQRKNEPYKAMWCLPGGFAENEEDLETAARRELQEETGLVIDTLEQFRTFSAPARDPRARTISVVHYTILAGDPPAVQGGDDASDARWFDINELPELGFDHPQIVQFILRKIWQDV